MYFSTSPWKGCTSTFMVLHPGHSGGQAVGLTLAAGPRPVSAHLLSAGCLCLAPSSRGLRRSEEHTSELQSQSNLVCRLLLEKKKPSHNSIEEPTSTRHL